MAKCPACNAAIDQVGMLNLKADSGGGKRACVGYVCPSCQALLGVEMDPLERRDRIIDEVVRSLKHR